MRSIETAEKKFDGQLDKPVTVTENNQNGFSVNKPLSSRAWITITLSSCALLVLLVLCCYLRTLGSYFLADDFGEVGYVSHIWAGEWKNYLLDWVSNVQRLSCMAVYRPWFITTLVFDFGLWKANAFGYYLDNVAHFTAGVVLLYVIARKLSERAGATASLLCGFFAAALFATSPLHCESISWSGGRTDTMCCTYFLAAMLFFLSRPSHNAAKATFGALAFYWLALLTKEMAVALPCVLTVVSFLFTEQAPPDTSTVWHSAKHRAIVALKSTWPFWLSTVIYFGIRYLALGTLVGGYTGGFGESVPALQRFADPDNYRRLLFPLAIGIFSPHNLLTKILSASYLTAGAVLFVRAWRRQISIANLCLLAAWFAVTAIPIYQVWGLGLNMEGARYFYFLTVPLSLTLPLLLFAPSNAQTDRSRSDLILRTLSVLALTALAASNFRIASETNGSWIHAGKEVRAVTSESARLSTSLPGDNHIIVLGIPKTYNGAHMFYNGATYFMSLSQPFFDKDYGHRFETFDPLFFGPDQYINSARFKKVLHSGSTQPYVWNSKHKKWQLAPMQASDNNSEPMELAPTGTANASLPTSEDERYTFALPNICPLDYDFVEFQYRLLSAPQQKALTFAVHWRGNVDSDGFPQKCIAASDEICSAADVGHWRALRIPVSHFWHWYACGNIENLSLTLPDSVQLDVKNLRLISDRQLRPRVSVVGSNCDGTGVFNVAAGTTVQVDATNIPGASSVLIECTKPNFLFDAFSPQQLETAIWIRRIEHQAKATAILDNRLCPLSNLCELRARALDDQGRPLGEFSEPVSLTVRP